MAHGTGFGFGPSGTASCRQRFPPRLSFGNRLRAVEPLLRGRRGPLDPAVGPLPQGLLGSRVLSRRRYIGHLAVRQIGAIGKAWSENGHILGLPSLHHPLDQERSHSWFTLAASPFGPGTVTFLVYPRCITLSTRNGHNLGLPSLSKNPQPPVFDLKIKPPHLPHPRRTEVLQPSVGDLRTKLSGDSRLVSPAPRLAPSPPDPNSRNREVETTPGCTQSEVRRWSAVRGSRWASSRAKRTLASLDSPYAT
eukprot:scaffold3433_cov108-Isochrysis_galbana.AAC.1